MTKYASFYPSASQPSPVTGWYDTAEFNYPNLPPADHLLLLNDQQWADRTKGSWAVENGTLVPYSPVAVAPT